MFEVPVAAVELGWFCAAGIVLGILGGTGLKLPPTGAPFGADVVDVGAVWFKLTPGNGFVSKGGVVEVGGTVGGALDIGGDIGARAGNDAVVEPGLGGNDPVLGTGGIFCGVARDMLGCAGDAPEVELAEATGCGVFVGGDVLLANEEPDGGNCT